MIIFCFVGAADVVLFNYNNNRLILSCFAIIFDFIKQTELSIGETEKISIYYIDKEIYL